MIISDEVVLRSNPQVLLNFLDSTPDSKKNNKQLISKAYCLFKTGKSISYLINVIVIKHQELPRISLELLSYVASKHGIKSYLNIVKKSSKQIFLHKTISIHFCKIITTTNLQDICNERENVKEIVSFILRENIDLSRQATNAACNIIENELNEKNPTIRKTLTVQAMKAGLICSAQFERIYTIDRRELFIEILEKKSCSPEESELIFSIAIQEFHKDYCSYRDNGESDTLTKIKNLLESKLNNGENISGLYLYLSLYAMYEPIDSINGVSLYKSELLPESLGTLIEIGINNQKELDSLIDTIPSLTSIDDPDSKKVREQYEQAPYPKWHRVTSIATPNLLSYLRFEKLPKPEKIVTSLARTPEILIAGCGTGQQPISMAIGMPYAKFTAIDISKQSIAYAIKRTKEHKIKNIKYYHADILKIEEVSKQYDIIICGGVLHHMKSPKNGLKALVGALKPNGLINIAVYSTSARRTITRHREIIAKEGVLPTVDNIRKYRARLLTSAVEKGSPLAVRDFYNLNECRDLLFHTHEKTYSWPEIGNWVSEEHLNLIKVNFPHNTPLDYKNLNGIVNNKVDFDFLEKYENSNPDTWISMMPFWCQKPA